MYLHKTPGIFKLLYPDLTWHKERNKKIIYLTFDDGPIPDVTDFVLTCLEEYKAKGTFFCVGENVSKFPSVFSKILRKGHTIGNHTYHHLNGWRTGLTDYCSNIEKCNEVLERENKMLTDRFFRPPYGRIKREQIKVLKKDYTIVMWDVLSGDFDKNLEQEICLKKSIKYSKPGSVIIFHDSIKAAKNIRYVLPRYLRHFSELGYSFASL